MGSSGAGETQQSYVADTNSSGSNNGYDNNDENENTRNINFDSQHLIKREQTGSDPKAIGLNDAKECIEASRNWFINSLPINGPEKFPEACSFLAEHRPTLFWALYCSEIKWCGVWIDFNGRPGRSPGVDGIINTCNNFGYPGLVDPGPPETTCGDNDEDMDVTALIGASDGYETPFPSSSSGATAVIMAPSSSSIQHASATADSQESTEASDDNSPKSDDGGGGLNNGAKAAVGICSAMAILALLVALLFLLRRRKKHKSSSFSSSNPFSYPTIGQSRNSIGRAISHPVGGGDLDDTYTPLVTPPPSSSSKTMPTTPPPLRLSDRKFLLPLSDQTYQRRATTSFPKSPICNPTTSRLVPRQEHYFHATTSSDLFLEPIPPIIPYSNNKSNSNHVIARNSSSSAGGVAVSPVTAYFPTTPPPPSPLSPVRPPRPHTESLRIPDLVSPDPGPSGPPPTRALPRRPTPAPAITMTTGLPQSPTTGRQKNKDPAFSAATGLTNNNNNNNNNNTAGSSSSSNNFSMPLPPPPRRHADDMSSSTTTLDSSRSTNPVTVTLSKSARDLCELTESYARETRESWGSWGGSGGGGPGFVVASGRNGGSGCGSPRRTSRDKKGGGVGGETGVAMQELDLEKLGGSY